jgi:hypothetical protein
MGMAVRRRRIAARGAVVAIVWLLAAATHAAAGDRYALIVAGASGGAEYAEQYARWSTELAQVLSGRMKISAERIRVLTDSTDPATASTAVNVRQQLAALRRVMTRDDLLLIVLIGHGTYDGVDAKFNLVGSDLQSAQWAELLAGVPGQVVMVNTSSASFPFLERLAGERRIVISATDSVAQRFDTVFPEYFIKAFQGDAADIDKNNRISIWEAFSAATNEVRRYYQRRGQLSTERALLDDNGDGVGHAAVGAAPFNDASGRAPGGREGTAKTEDGSVASHVYLDDPLPGAPPTDEVLVKLLQARAAAEGELEDLKIRRSFLPPAEYQKEFERLMVELARVNREIKARVKS